MKYKVGDIVLVAKIDHKSFHYCARYEGKVGKIIRVAKLSTDNSDNYWPYKVKFENLGIDNFSEKELVPASEAAKILYGVK